MPLNPCESFHETVKRILGELTDRHPQVSKPHHFHLKHDSEPVALGCVENPVSSAKGSTKTARLGD